MVTCVTRFDCGANKQLCSLQCVGSCGGSRSSNCGLVQDFVRNLPSVEGELCLQQSPGRVRISWKVLPNYSSARWAVPSTVALSHHSPSSLPASLGFGHGSGLANGYIYVPWRRTLNIIRCSQSTYRTSKQSYMPLFRVQDVGVVARASAVRTQIRVFN